MTNGIRQREPKLIDLQKFTIDLDPDREPFPAICGPAELMAIESRCGSISGLARSFAETDASFTQCGEIAFIILRAGAPDSFPSRNEINQLMFNLGILTAIERLIPFMTKVMGGEDDGGD